MQKFGQQLGSQITEGLENIQLKKLQEQKGIEEGKKTPVDSWKLEQEAAAAAVPDSPTLTQPNPLTKKVQEQGRQQEQASNWFQKMMAQDAKLQSQMAAELKKASEIENNLKKVEPYRFFHSMSTPSKIVAAIGMLAAGAAAKTPEEVQGVYDVMNAAINQDIQSQKLDQQHQLMAAKEARNRAQGIIDRYSKLRISPDTKARLGQLHAKLEQDKQVLAAQQQREMLKGFTKRLIETGKAQHVPAEMLAKVYSPKELTRMDKMRGDLEKERKDAKVGAVVDSYRRMHAYVSDPSQFSGPGDIAMVFNFMKTLDPASVVRESEFVTAAKAGSRAYEFARQWNRFITGERFVEADRKAFLNSVRGLVEPAMKTDQFIKDKYARVARRWGYPPSLIVTPSPKWKDLPGGAKEIQWKEYLKRNPNKTRADFEEAYESVLETKRTK